MINNTHAIYLDYVVCLRCLITFSDREGATRCVDLEVFFTSASEAWSSRSVTVN